MSREQWFKCDEWVNDAWQKDIQEMTLIEWWTALVT